MAMPGRTRGYHPKSCLEDQTTALGLYRGRILQSQEFLVKLWSAGSLSKVQVCKTLLAPRK
jgi:hypothetical protein